MSCCPVGISFHGGDDDSGGVFVVETKAKAGMVLESHVHPHGHLSVLVSGTADVTIDDKTERLTGYCMVKVPAGLKHKVQAVSDVVWLCLSSADDLDTKYQAVESLKLLEGI
jgi:quercetin dioxygenase-like cupin family protein